MIRNPQHNLPNWALLTVIALSVTVLAWWSVGEWLLQRPQVLSEVVAVSEPAEAAEPERPEEQLADPPERAAAADASLTDRVAPDAESPAPAPVVQSTPVALAVPAAEDAPTEEPEAAPAPEQAAIVPPEQAPEMPAVSQADANNEASDLAEFRAEFDNTVEEQTIAEDAIAEGEVGPTEHQGAEPMEHVRGTSDLAGEVAETALRAVAPEESEQVQVGAETNESGDGREPAQAREGLATGQADSATVQQAVAAREPERVEPEAVSPAAAAEEDSAVLEDDDGVSPEIVEGDGAPSPTVGSPQAPVTGVAAAVATMRPNFAAMQASPGPLGEVGGVGAEGYTSVFGGRDNADRERLARAAREASIAGDHEGRWERTRGALENYDVAITAGSETRLNTRSDVTAGYIHALHNRIHEPWRTYLARLDREYGAANGVADPHRYGPSGGGLSSRGLSDPNLRVEVELVLDSGGNVVDVNIARGSGELTFDAEAVDMLYRIGPHRPPPESLLSYDGNTYVRWAFHRDDRACGSFNASIRWLSPAGDTRGG